MERSQILREIKRIAGENAGKAPGRQVFERHTGVRINDWYPHLWLRWGEALAEAGFAANKLRAPISEEVLIQKYIDLAKELKHLPVEGELRRRGRKDKTFPTHSTFRRLGGKEKLLDAVLRYCHEHPGNEDVIALFETRERAPKRDDSARVGSSQLSTGFVYLMKSGRHYKIGLTNSLGSRERQLAIKIPIPPTTIHSIETDDPRGVEAYWHARFATKRGEGEWFDLSPDDIRAFKRWKRIV